MKAGASGLTHLSIDNRRQEFLPLTSEKIAETRSWKMKTLSGAQKNCALDSNKPYHDASAVKNPEPLENQQMPHRVATVRSERGYSATNYDATVVNLPKPSRGQFGQNYDDKKVLNK